MTDANRAITRQDAATLLRLKAASVRRPRGYLVNKSQMQFLAPVHFTFVSCSALVIRALESVVMMMVSP